MLVPGARRQRAGIRDQVVPGDRELEGRTRVERAREIDTHLGAVDDVIERAAVTRDLGDLVTAVEGAHELLSAHAAIADARVGADRARELVVGIAAEAILVKLNPYVAQSFRRVVRVPDRFPPDDLALCLVEGDVDVVVGALLPVLGPWCTSCASVHVRVGQRLVELAKVVLETAFGLGDLAV